MLDALLPPQCLCCDAPVGGQGQLCSSCFSAVHFITDPCCASCGRPFSHAGEGDAKGLCPGCHAARPAWGQARAAMVYDAHSKGMVLALKHGDRPELANALGAMMARAGAAMLRRVDLLVPVPLHPARLRARRYNQAALLARAVGRSSGTAVQVDALVRLHATQPLGELSAEDRAATVAGVFAARRGAGARLAGLRVALVDDVLTSGATAEACTLALLHAGVAAVDVLVAARVPHPRDR